MRQSPDLCVTRRLAGVSRSAAEEQPQQNDHRNWHAQQPQQKSSSHHILLKMQSRSERAMPWPVPVRKRSWREGTFSSNFAEWRLRVGRHSLSRVPDGNGAFRMSRAGRSDGGRARRNCTGLTSGRCSASRTTAPPAASDRPSATARSNADRASARRPCCRRAAAG